MNKTTQKGFTLIEILVAVFLLAIIISAGAALVHMQGNAVNDYTDISAAEDHLEQALSNLTARVSDLEPGQSYKPVSDGEIELLGCNEKNCDYVLLPDAPKSLKTSAAGGVPYGAKLPDGSAVLFLRRWRVTDINSSYRLHNIGVAILADEKSTEPIISQDTTVSLEE